ncbi:MAG: hypothetical protein OXU20_24580 [Myxococcales bacterium]|nr:hypothetical protein [Myxococcales bacterium]MDD9971940.1 hypothetical protein [Myxococcales bacterium]
MATKNGILNPILLAVLLAFGTACGGDDPPPATGATEGAATGMPGGAMPGGAAELNACPNAGPTCGNGTIEAGEVCDQGNAAMNIPANFNNMDCTVLTGGYGSITCKCCQIFTDSCMVAPTPAAAAPTDAAGGMAAPAGMMPMGGQGG